MGQGLGKWGSLSGLLLGFGKERERSRCRGTQFFFPCLCVRVQGKKKNPQYYSKQHRFELLLFLVFFLTMDETTPFYPKHAVSFKKK
jgi:hypothetical protein